MPVRYHIIGLLFLGTTINYADRVNIADWQLGDAFLRRGGVRRRQQCDFHIPCNS